MRIYSFMNGGSSGLQIKLIVIHKMYLYVKKIGLRIKNGHINQ